MPELEAEIAAIQALGASGEAEQPSNAIIAIFEEEIADAESDPQSFVLGGKPVIEATTEARKLGFKSCGGV